MIHHQPRASQTALSAMALQEAVARYLLNIQADCNVRNQALRCVTLG